MKQQDWQTVVAALLHLGCEMVNQSDFQIAICRGAIKIMRIRKLSPMTIQMQRNLIGALDLDEADFLAALAERE